MKITSIERNKKNKERLSVFIDGRYSFSMPEDEYLRMNMYEKGDISETEINYIKNVLNYRSAKAKAVRLLSLKLRSEKEVGCKLENEGFDRETIYKVLEELKSIGYINDKIYTQKYVYDRSKLKPKAKKMLRYELESKGIDIDIIEEVLNTMELDEVSISEGLIKKKFGKYDLSDGRIVNKVKAFLHHRGFSLSTIETALKNIKDEN